MSIAGRIPSRLLCALVFLLTLPVQSQDEEAAGKRQVNFALGLFQREEYKEAQAEFETYLENPAWKAERELALFFSAEAHRRADQRERAEKRYRELIESFPKSQYEPPARHRLAQLRLQKRDGVGALEILKPLAERKLSDELAEGVFYSFGVAHSLVRNSKEAISWWEKVRRRFPDSVSARQALLGMGVESSRLGNWAEAKDHIEAWLSSKDAPKKPAYPEALSRLAEAEERLGDKQESLALRLQLSNLETAKDFVENALLDAARLASELEDWKTFDELRPRLEKEVVTQKAYAQGQILIGNRFYRNREWKDARAAYERALAGIGGAKATRTDLLSRLGWTCFALEDWESVIETIGQLESKEDDEVLYLLAEAHRRLEHWEDSKEWFAKISAGSRYESETERGLADNAYRLELWEEARTRYVDLAKTGEKDEERAFFLLRAADAARKLELWAESAKDCSLAAETTANGETEERALYLAGWSSLRAKDPRSAIEPLERLIERHKESERVPESLYMLGQAHDRVEDPTRECETLEVLVEEFPDTRWTADGLLRLAAAYSKRDLREGVLSSLLRYQQRYPDIPLHEEYALWLAEELVDSGSFETALGTLSPLLDRDLPAGEIEKCRNLIGLCHENLERWPEALDAYEEALELAPEGGFVLACRLGAGTAATRLGDASKAWEHVRAALDWITEKPSLEPEIEARVYLLAGDLSYEAGDYVSAYRSYARPSILYRHPKWTPIALSKSALCKDELGEPEKATELREELARDYPDYRAEVETP